MFKKKNEVKQQEVKAELINDETVEEVEEKGSFANTIVRILPVSIANSFTSL